MTILLTIALLGAAALFLLTSTSVLGMPLALASFLRPLPLFVIGNRYGALTALLAGTLGSLLVHLVFPFPLGIITFITIAFPLFCMVHLTHKGLEFQKTLPQFVIDPFGMVMFFTVLFILFTSLFMFIFFFGFDFASYEKEVRDVFAKALKAFDGVFNQQPEMKPLGELLINASPFLMPAFTIMIWSLFMLGNYFLSFYIKRKDEKVPNGLNFLFLRLPTAALLLLAFSLILTLFSGFPQLLGVITFSALFIPLTFQGLAVIHVKTLGKTWRKGFLVGFYFTILVLGWSIFIPFTLGLMDLAFNFRFKQKTN